MGGLAVSLGLSFKWSILQVLEQGNVENLGWDCLLARELRGRALDQGVLDALDQKSSLPGKVLQEPQCARGATEGAPALPSPLAPLHAGVGLQETRINRAGAQLRASSAAGEDWLAQRRWGIVLVLAAGGRQRDSCMCIFCLFTSLRQVPEPRTGQILCLNLSPAIPQLGDLAQRI